MDQSPNHEAVFDRMFGRYHQDVQSYCLRRLPVDDVNDATAEVFLVAWRRIEHAPEDNELPWLYGIARNIVRNTYRSRRRHNRLTRRLRGLREESKPGPETQLVLRYEDEALHRALATLSFRDQEVLRLRTWEELSNSEIAAVMDTTVHATDMRISRAKRRLAKAFEDHQKPSRTTTNRPRFVEEGGEW